MDTLSLYTNPRNEYCSLPTIGINGVCKMSTFEDGVTGLRRIFFKDVVSDNDGGGSSHALIASVHLTLVKLYIYSTISSS